MKKVLIVSATPMRNDTNMGKTLSTLFSDFEKNELVQLYFNPSLPNVDICSSYYQICEKQIINSGFGIKKDKCGGEIFPLNEKISYKENALVLTRRKGTIVVRWLRECVWYIGKWKNKNFLNWLDREKPDIIFSIMHDTNYAPKAVAWIAEKINVPVVLFVTDDYYNDSQEKKSLLRRLYYKQRKTANKKLAKYCSTIIGCSEKAAEYFSVELNIKNKKVFYTPSAKEYTELPYRLQSNQGLIKIRYFGNLGLGRWKMLQSLGLMIQKINENKKQAILEVYSAVTDTLITNELNIKNGCEFKGFVIGDEYMSLLQSADIAVHVESFDTNMIQRTWVSISTKIADYLGAGKCILAIGSEKLASIQHIQDAACIVTDLDDLENKLDFLIKNVNYRTELQNKARSLSREKHDICVIRKVVREVIEEYGK